MPPKIWIVLLLVGCASHAASDRHTARAAEKRGGEAYERKAWAECAADYSLAAAADPASRPDSLYNMACCLALGGDKDKALARLAEAVDAGNDDVATLARDGDLASLRDDARWQAIAKKAEAAHERAVAGENAELRALYEADQAARAMPYEKIDWSIVNPEDHARQKRVEEIVAGSGAKVSGDYYHAAMVFQHAEGVDGIRKAHEWALKAAELDPRNRKARWLAAASLDRALMYQGEPQKYGTQFKKIDGKWRVWPVDPAITDDERDEWDCPSIADARKRAEAMNASH